MVACAYGERHTAAIGRKCHFGIFLKGLQRVPMTVVGHIGCCHLGAIQLHTFKAVAGLFRLLYLQAASLSALGSGNMKAIPSAFGNYHLAAVAHDSRYALPGSIDIQRCRRLLKVIELVNHTQLGIFVNIERGRCIAHQPVTSVGHCAVTRIHGYDVFA